jgi:uncharacterized protein (DUF608 family)
MSNRSGRRSFLKGIGMSGAATTLIPSSLLALGEADAQKAKVKDGKEDPSGHAFNGPYTGAYLNRLAFPMGGMGAGMVCLEGTGALSHLSVRNKPDVFFEPGLFAALFVKDVPNGAKVLEGPVPDWKKFGRKDAGNGDTGATTGLPRFRNVSFRTQFPFGVISLSDPDHPVHVEVTGWSPFIPGDDKNSSLPLAAMEYRFTNTGTKTLELIFSWNAKNFLRLDEGKNSISPLDNGFILTEMGNKSNPFRTDFSVSADDPTTVVDHCWFRGGWWDPMTMAWNHVRDGVLRQTAAVEKDAPGASLYVPFNLAPGKEKTIRLMMAWYTPESAETYGQTGPDKTGCNPENGCCNSPGDIGLDPYDKDFKEKYYKPYYASQFASIGELTAYWKTHYDDLRKSSARFRDAFYDSTLPAEVIEAVAANLTILKSPTVMRQYDGRLWSWEGCGDNWGCCHGSCTHVWNYAQAIPHLFPALERSLRHTEFCENQDMRGHQTFRATLPIMPNTHDFHAAADGQLGGIMKAYREWRISGDNEWLGKMYPMVRTSMDYSISTWDPRERGLIEEPHHNTYDIEFWGPDGMHVSFYLGALSAMVAMGQALGKEVKRYQELLAKGKAFMESSLYDGEFFIQEIKYTGLNAKDPVTTQSFGGEYSTEAKDLLQKEGPKYQYGKGCLSDGVLGAWIARMCGINDVLEPAKIRSHLKAVHRYNLKDNLQEHANPQRPSFALGEEGGLLLCTWPKGGKLSLPFVYSDEVWTGIEHQAASHMMMTGLLKEGLEVVRLSRKRYDGRVRNPFNEYECGHWYARALSSYGYLQALTGVRYDAVEKTLYIDSQVGDFRSFLSTASGFGTVSLKGGKPSIKMVSGKIDLKKVVIAGKETAYQVV